MTHFVHVFLAALIAIVIAAFTIKILMGIAWLALWFAIAFVKFAIFAVVAVFIFVIVYTKLHSKV